MLGEKPPVMALRRWMPDVLTVGFQHYAGQHPLMLCLFTTPEEAAFAPHPDVIVCNSPLTAAQLVEAGFPPRKLRVGPSLRFLDSVPAEVERTPEPESVLVVLAMDPMASRELLSKLLAAFPEDEGIRFWVKPHPMMSLKQFAALLGGRPLPPHMTRVEGPMSDWLARATVAVVVATTAALEVALAAIPVVLVGRETDFDQNPLDGFTGFERPVYAAATLRTRVHEKLALAPEDALRLQEWARRVRRECLSPLNERTLSAFVRRGGVEDPVAACAASGECVGAVPSHSRPVEDR
jgi:surface carbohydrate biosynthesis protein (TIGR04326 family)